MLLSVLVIPNGGLKYAARVLNSGTWYIYTLPTGAAKVGWSGLGLFSNYFSFF